MKKTIIAFSFIAGLSFGVFAADEYYKNMPTYADGHNIPAPYEDIPTADFSYKPASKHTAKANREAAKRLPYSDKTALSG